MNILKNNIPLLERPYRSCVGLMVFNKEGNVFCGQRLDNKVEAWQLPQGGIDKGEIPIEAGYRELKEETSITNIEFISEYPEWLNYDIPLPLADNLWEGKYRGQTQRWLLFHFMGEDKEKQQIKNDLKTMEMVLKEYLDYSEKINEKRISSVNILNLIIEVTSSSNELKKKNKNFL